VTSDAVKWSVPPELPSGRIQESASKRIQRFKPLINDIWAIGVVLFGKRQRFGKCVRWA
jgi:hypothetical protein